ncbi:hypothetical protein BDR22DRAFT_392988 [Usnea florida]
MSNQHCSSTKSNIGLMKVKTKYRKKILWLQFSNISYPTPQKRTGKYSLIISQNTIRACNVKLAKSLRYDYSTAANDVVTREHNVGLYLAKTYAERLFACVQHPEQNHLMINFSILHPHLTADIPHQASHPWNHHRESAEAPEEAAPKIKINLILLDSLAATYAELSTTNQPQGSPKAFYLAEPLNPWLKDQRYVACNKSSVANASGSTGRIIVPRSGLSRGYWEGAWSRPQGGSIRELWPQSQYDMTMSTRVANATTKT